MSNQPLDKSSLEIIERLKKVRMDSGLSQAGFAAAIGVSQGNVGIWETGRALPGALALIAINQKFDCSIDWLLTGAQPKNDNNKVEAVFDPDLKMIIDVMTNLLHNPDHNLRGWAIIHFKEAFEKYWVMEEEKKEHA